MFRAHIFWATIWATIPTTFLVATIARPVTMHIASKALLTSPAVGENDCH
jgi:hypothetical protein